MIKMILNGFLFASLISLTALVYGQAEPATQPSVTDFSGARVSLNAPARRIITLAPASAENVYSAGAGQYLVAVVEHSDYPEAARSLPRIGNFNSWSIESIVALKPDLVLFWGSGNSAKILNKLRQLGYPVYVTEPRKISDIAKLIRDIGILAGTQHIAEAVADEFEQAIQALAKAYQNQAKLRVFYEVWNQPLQTLNGEHLISELITLCGGENVFAEAIPLAPKLSLESVLHANPEAIIASSPYANQARWGEAWRQYPSIAAVQQDALYYINADYLQRPTVRVLAGAEALCHKLDNARRKAGQ